MLNPGRSGGPSSTGKFVILQSRAQTPTSSGVNANSGQQQHSQQQQSQQVKITQGTTGQQKSHLQGSAPKLVVVCMPNSGHSVTSTVTQVNNIFFTLRILFYIWNSFYCIDKLKGHSRMNMYVLPPLGSG